MADKRYSIVVNDLSECFICGRPHPHKHEIFFGRTGNREKSIEDGMVIALCYEHHEGIFSPHRNREFDLTLKRNAQAIWESKYGERGDFIERYGKSYL